MGSFRYSAFYMQHAKVIFRLYFSKVQMIFIFLVDPMELCLDTANENKYHTVSINDGL